MTPQHLWITPDWPAPPTVKALITTRLGGVSGGFYESMNLADHVNDAEQCVVANRTLLREVLPGEPAWLRQVHGTNVVVADEVTELVDADASYTRKPGVVCAVLTADCLPLLVCDRAGSHVAAIHAGWRGMSNAVIEQAIEAMAVPPSELLVYLGPAIGPESYEVGEDVLEAFLSDDDETATAFMPRENGKWLANLYELAKFRLWRMGIEAIYGGDYCTMKDLRFYSYRRHHITGRMASLIWLDR